MDGNETNAPDGYLIASRSQWKLPDSQAANCMTAFLSMGTVDCMDLGD
jgi:hypothetical protein